MGLFLPSENARIELISEVVSEYRNYSDFALSYTYEDTAFRLAFLRWNRGNLEFYAQEPAELDEMFALAERLDRVGASERRFARKKAEIEMELIRRANLQ